MALTYTFKVIHNLLIVKTGGKADNLGQLNQYAMEIMTKTIESGCSSVLCDETDVEYTLRSSDLFESANMISQKAPRVAKVAVVCKPEHINDAGFFETVASNRGLRIKAFQVRADAEEWLK